MSRTGNMPVEVPSGTEVTIAGQKISAKGKLGLLSLDVAREIEVSKEDNRVILKPRNDDQRTRVLWGTSRSNVDNMVQGVSTGFAKRLIITGTGYRAAVKGKVLNLQLGYSHDIDFPISDDITIACPEQTVIDISGADKQLVGQVAAEIRAFRKPEPYKGKGIKYADEQILRKEGKKK